MHIWIITIGEPLPIDNDNVRLYRTGILSNMLVEKGHNVIWWTSSFDHTNKKHRFIKDNSFFINSLYKIQLLHSIAYKKNISLFRILNHYGIAKKFQKISYSEPNPDLILCSFPPIELCNKAIEYGKKKNIPVVIDARDMWPDIFLKLVPPVMEILMKFILFPLFLKTKRIFKNAEAIFGITNTFVEWGLNYAGRKMTFFDRDFPLAYYQKKIGPDVFKKGIAFWQDNGLDNKQYKFIACFFGAINRQFEIDTIIKAAQTIQTLGLKVLFVICGTGDNLAYYKDLAKGIDNIIFPGWIGKDEIQVLMNISSVGIAPYNSSVDFMASLPNKSIEYLSAGLPIISSLIGTLEELLNKYKCGITYQNKNVDDFIKKIIYLYDNPSIVKQMSKNALRLFKEKFVAKKVYGEMIAHLEKIVKEYNKDKRLNVS